MEQQSLEGKVYNAIYADGHFEKIELGQLINKGGAAGRIFANKNDAKTVAKIYHEKNKSSTNRKKLEAMLHNVPHLPSETKNGVEYIQIAWPTALLEDEEGFCVGYLMPKIDTSLAVSLDHLMQKAVRQKLKLSEKYSYRILAAYNLTCMVAAMHQCGHYIVDLKPSNVFVYKSTMSVVMFDCDGFSILGEFGRYPSEYVSEEYIYPEGIDQSCEEMGEEQDNFALAVTIFKLLNNGIHPFSGTPRKKSDPMLTIQERVFGYHYSYGLWPDLYQSPHPYSIHEYFDKKTLEMFERAFVKGKKRPTAKEWQEHIGYLLKIMKQCKKDRNHIYFTAKGCGLCIAEEKFSSKIDALRKEKSMPAQIRGVELSAIDIKKTEQKKADEKNKKEKMQKLCIFGFGVYFLFFSLLYPILRPLKEYITSQGIGIQLLVILFITSVIHRNLNRIMKKAEFDKFYGIAEMMEIFALFCMLITFVILNEFSFEILTLSK